MPRAGFKPVGIPEDLCGRIEKYIKQHPELGYTGLPEFVRDILRKELHDLELKRVVAT